jgi:hypothetical protein
LCRDVAQPGRALAWGARGRQFKSARPDQIIQLIAYRLYRQCSWQLPIREAPQPRSRERMPNLACEGCEAQPSPRQFKSARPDQIIQLIAFSLVLASQSATAYPRSAPTAFARANARVRPARGARHSRALGSSNLPVPTIYLAHHRNTIVRGGLHRLPAINSHLVQVDVSPGCSAAAAVDLEVSQKRRRPAKRVAGEDCKV